MRAENYPVTRTPRFFPAKLTRSFASKPCPSLTSTPLPCSVPGFVRVDMFADRPHRLRDHGRPSSGRGGNLWATEAPGGRRAAGMRGHRREYNILGRLAAAADRIRPPSLAQPCRLLTSVPLLGVSCSCSCSSSSSARRRRRWRCRPRRCSAGEQAPREFSRACGAQIFFARLRRARESGGGLVRVSVSASPVCIYGAFCDFP